MKKCNMCKLERDNDEFHKMSCAPDGLAYTCKSCADITAFNWSTKTLRGRLSRLCAAARQRCKKRNWVFGASVEILENMWREQGGKCAYSGIPLSLHGDWQVSLERKDPIRGYELDNICLICLELNVSEQWSPEKMEALKKLPRFEEVNYSDKISSFRYTAAHRGGIDLVFLRKKLYSARGRVKTWNVENRNMEDTICDLSLEDVVRLLSEQKGLCAYSGFHMTFTTGDDFAVSLERKNPRRGYYKDNVILVCKIFNVGDHRVERARDHASHPTWSRDKFEQFWNALHQV